MNNKNKIVTTFITNCTYFDQLVNNFLNYTINATINAINVIINMDAKIYDIKTISNM